MEIDHFNPTLKRAAIQDYANLFLATRHCNGAKGNQWENHQRRQRGARFLNCCKETDYGVHIFEDPDTHKLVGVTPEGKYHVRNCDLNAPHLVRERLERAQLFQLLQRTPICVKPGIPIPKEADKITLIIQQLTTIAGKMIPPIPYLCGTALQEHRKRQLALAACAPPTFTSASTYTPILPL
jgi:hypothetical protein